MIVMSKKGNCKDRLKLMKTVRSDIIIDASKERVWRILTNFDAYHLWNPLIVSIEGDAMLNSRLNNKLRLGDGTNMNFKPKITAYEPLKKREWIGRLFIPGLIDGRHYFIIEELQKNKVRLINGEDFTGVLLNPLLLLKPSVISNTREGFIAMNNALKLQAESQS